MKVIIDYDRCTGEGHCAEICPEVFEYDDVQLEVHVAVEEVPEELEDHVRQAAEECPTGAISIED
jgi:ferredoxin